MNIKLCPILPPNYTEDITAKGKTRKTTMPSCYDNCAWYNKEAKECYLVTMAKRMQFQTKI